MIKQTVDDRTARKSALLVATVLALITAWSFYRGRMTMALVLGIFSALLFLIVMLETQPIRI